MPAPETPEHKLSELQDLEKKNRVLERKLARLERTCIELETTNQKKETLLRQVIQELRESQEEAQGKRQLEQTLIDLKETQAQLIQAEKMSSLGQLVAGLAHEINNPVNFIHGNLHYIQDYTTTLLDLIHFCQSNHPEVWSGMTEKFDLNDLDFIQEDLFKVVRSIRLGTDRIHKIVLSLRNFSRLDESGIKPIDLHSSLDSTIFILNHLFQGHDTYPLIEVERNYGDLPIVDCYAGEINQVFMNVLMNAVEAIHAKHSVLDCSDVLVYQGRVVIETRRLLKDDREWVEIKISDNGCGMPTQVQNQIFNPFFSTKPVGQGTGMGMSISYQIITERHGGKIQCCSRVDEGTEFRIEIPARQTLPRFEDHGFGA